MTVTCPEMIKMGPFAETFLRSSPELINNLKDRHAYMLYKIYPPSTYVKIEVKKC